MLDVHISHMKCTLISRVQCKFVVTTEISSAIHRCQSQHSNIFWMSTNLMSIVQIVRELCEYGFGQCSMGAAPKWMNDGISAVKLFACSTSTTEIFGKKWWAWDRFWVAKRKFTDSMYSLGFLWGLTNWNQNFKRPISAHANWINNAKWMIFNVHIMFDAKSNQLWSINYIKRGILIQIERWRNQIPKLKDTIKSIKVQCDDRFLSLSKPELLLWFTEWWKICYDYEINANALHQQIFRHHIVIWQFSFVLLFLLYSHVCLVICAVNPTIMI